MAMNATKKKSTKFLALLAASGMLFAACGSDGSTGSAEDAVSGDTPVAEGDTLGAFGDGCAAVPAEGAGSFAGMAEETAGTAASNNPVLSTLVTAVVEADLVDTLNSDGPFTIFAPTNDAFAAIDEDILAAVLADKELLTSVLTYHVVAGDSIKAADLADSTQTSVEGGELTLGADGTKVNDSNVICSDVPVANGTVHIVDAVLLPQVALDAIATLTGGEMEEGEMEEGAMAETAQFGPACSAVPADGEGSFAGMADDTAGTAASNNPVLSTLVTAVVEADLVDTLNSDGPFTIFAPTNDAFAAIPEADLAAVLADKDLLTSILTFHVIAGDQLDADALIAAGSATTVNGADLTFAAEGDSVSINGSAVVGCANVATANATVHIIDSVLMPA